MEQNIQCRKSTQLYIINTGIKKKTSYVKIGTVTVFTSTSLSYKRMHAIKNQTSFKEHIERHLLCSWLVLHV